MVSLIVEVLLKMSGTANYKESARATQVAAPGDTKFNDAYDRALIRKRLFKVT